MSLLTNITNAIGLTESTFFDDMQDEYAIVTEGVWKAVNALPPTFIMKAVEPLDPLNIPDDVTADEVTVDGTDYLVKDGYTFNATDILLAVERVTNTGGTLNSDSTALNNREGLDRYCKKIMVTEKHSALDSGSIYYATDWSPVYWCESVADDTNEDKYAIYSAPASNPTVAQISEHNVMTRESALRVWVYSKQTIDANTTSLADIPTTGLNFVHKFAGLELINALVSRQALEEEDAEMYQLLMGHKKVLEEELANELVGFNQRYGK